MFSSGPRTVQQMEAEVVRISVYDANTLLRNELIGTFQLDLSYVYFQPHHEVHRQWVALTHTDLAVPGVQVGHKRCSVPRHA